MPEDLYHLMRLRDHVVSEHHGLDRVKLSVQHGPLGSIDRPDADRIAELWNAARGMKTEEAVRRLQTIPQEID
jgi:hypothetical protein